MSVLIKFCSVVESGSMTWGKHRSLLLSLIFNHTGAGFQETGSGLFRQQSVGKWHDEKIQLWIDGQPGGLDLLHHTTVAPEER